MPMNQRTISALIILVTLATLLAKCDYMPPASSTPSTPEAQLQTALNAANRGDYQAASAAAKAVLAQKPELLFGKEAMTALFGKVSLSSPLLGQATDQLQRVELTYRWSGLADRHDATITLERTADGSHFSGQFELDGKSAPLDLPRSDVLSLSQALTDLVPTSKPMSIIAHTDDYPHWNIKLLYPNNASVEVSSDSNAPYYMPWNISYQNQNRVQYSKAFANALITFVGDRIPYVAAHSGDYGDYDETTYFGWDSWITK
jgi:hypothetical protein